MKDIATKVDLTDTLPANAFNSISSELENAVTTSGQTLDSTPETDPDPDPTQIARAMTKASQEAGHYVDTGTADTYVLTTSGSWQQPTAYTNGARFYFTPSNANTGASVVNVAGLGSKDIKNVNGTALNAGQLVATKQAAIFFDSASDDFFLDDPTFGFTSGTGVQDTYVENFGAETGVEGWTTYKDAAQSTPTDGTGGSPNITFLRVLSNPLEGLASFDFVKDGADRQGEGVSNDFKIPESKRGLLNSITFPFTVVSGTYVDGDIRIYMYDKDTNTLITPNAVDLNDRTDINYHQVTFAIPTVASDDYRFIIHVATSSAAAYTLKFDQFIINANPPDLGANIGDWEDVTSKLSYGWGSNNAESKMFRKIDGGDYIYRGVLEPAATTGNATITLDHAVDFSNLSATSSDTTVYLLVGMMQRIRDSVFNSANHRGVWAVDSDAPTVIYFRIDPTSSVNFGGPVTSTSVFNSGDPLMIEVRVPITGAKGTLPIFNDNVAFANAKVRYYDNTGGAVAGGTAWTYQTEDIVTAETVGPWTNTAGVIGVPVDGTYDINFVNQVSSLAANRLMSLEVNRAGGGFAIERSTGYGLTSDLSVAGKVEGIKLAKGDLIKITTTGSVTLTSGSANSYIEIVRNQDFSAGQGAGVALAGADNFGLVKKNATLIESIDNNYTASASDILLSGANIPDGTYRVTVGSLFFRELPDQDCTIVPQLNGSDILFEGATWRVGPNQTSAFSGESIHIYGVTGVRIMTFSGGNNQFSLDIDISGSSIVADPYYILEKLENYTEITTEWD